MEVFVSAVAAFWRCIFGRFIKQEESIPPFLSFFFFYFYFPPGRRRVCPDLLHLGFGIWQRLFSDLSKHIPFSFSFSFLFFNLEFQSETRSLAQWFSFSFFFFCLGSYMMATLPGTVPRMVRPAPGQNYPRTGFPLEGEDKDSHGCLILELVLV